MRARIVKVGNSRGVRIPKALLEEAGLVDALEMSVVDGELHISAVEPATGNHFGVVSEQALASLTRG